MEVHIAKLRRLGLKKGWGEPELLFPSDVNTKLDHNNVVKVFDQRQLKFPPGDNWNSRFSGGLKIVQTPEAKGDWIGNRLSGEEADEVIERGANVVVGGGEIRDG